jgi:hypothetical protein
MRPLQAIAGDRRSDVELKLEKIPTSIDGLSSKNPVLITLMNTPFEKGVPFHSIIGNQEAGDTPGGSDGVVPYESSHLDGAASEVIVHSGHSAHNHPLSVLEVQRILKLHLKKK